MTPEFAAAVDPVFLHVIASMDRIRAGERMDPQQLHSTTQAKIRQAEESLRGRPQLDMWRIAMYGLCAWIDDLMINHPWDGQRWWENHKLEFLFFNTNEAGTAFYRKAKEAQQLAGRDALEVYYIAVVLGFRGLYALPDTTSVAHQFDLPPTIEEWARRTATVVQIGPPQWTQKDRSIPVRGAPPMEGRNTLVGAVILFFMLLVVASILGYRILIYK